MPNYTSNYKLTKPLPSDLYNIDHQNNNMDVIDTNLKKVSNVADEGNARSKTNASNLEALKSFQEDPFEETGSVVQVDLFQDAALNVVSKIEPIHEGSGDPFPAGGSTQLFDVHTNTSSTPVIGDDDWVTMNVDNTSGTSITYASLYTPVSDRLVEGKQYVVVTEIKELTGAYLIAVGTTTTSNKSQFAEGATYETVGTKVKVITALDDFSDCATMLRTNLGVYAGQIGKCVYRISILEDTTVTADTFEYMPYANIRAISGRTAASLTRCGKNLMDLSKFTGNSNVEYELNGDSVRVYTTANGIYKGFNSPTIILRGGVTYTLSAKVTNKVGQSIVIGFRSRYAVDGLNAGQFISGAILRDASSSSNLAVGEYKRTFKLNKDIAAYLALLVTESVEMSGDATFADIQLEVNSDKTAYERYHGDDFSMNLGQTVYGGTLDWNKGILTVDTACDAIIGDNVSGMTDGGSETAMFIVDISNRAIHPDTHKTESPISSTYKGVSWINNPWLVNNSISYYRNTSLRIKDNRFGNVSDFKAYLDELRTAGTPVQVVYKLAAPTSVQLSSHELSALAGINTLYSDSGDTTVSGRKDIIWLTHSLIKRIEALEAQVAGL